MGSLVSKPLPKHCYVDKYGNVIDKQTDESVGFVYEFNLLQLVEMGINTTNIQW